MKYFLIVFLSFLSIQISFSQINQLWKGYFSYNSIKDITQSETRFYAASENALFSKSTITSEIKTINTIDGLTSQTISSVYHSSAFNKTLIGYENGYMIVINDADGNILNVVDIINKQLPPNIKKINHFNEYQGIVYISCDFGIVQYNLNTMQFGDTYFIGNTTAELVVTQTTVFNGYIYASTLTEGIRRAEITNPNLIDATQWLQVAPGNFLAVETFSDTLFIASVGGQVYKSINGTSFFTFGNLLSPATADVRANDNYFIITTPNAVYIYNQQFALILQINNSEITDVDVNFSCATIIGNTVYIGTTEHGVITTKLNNPLDFQFISPSGPVKNNIFSINISSSNLWAVYGSYSENLTPTNTTKYGISKYNETKGWTNFTNANLSGAKDLVRVTVNPANENQIFISSFGSGLLKFENDALTKLYNQTNSGLETLIDPKDPNYVLVAIEQSAFDKSGNLWMTNGLLKKPLKELKTNGEWQSYNMESVLTNYYDSRFMKLTIDKNDTKWMCTRSDGLIGFNENANPQFKTLRDAADTGNLPSLRIQAATIDNRNQMWIGTSLGLRVISVDRFLGEDNLKANSIIILEDGIGQELFYQQYITDIVVDGANNKWVGTLSAGVFQVSPDGQETLQHFTSTNSPLPSNAINDIDINATTGEVFFATDKGMVSFKGTAIKAVDDLNNVVVYPNPVRPGFAGTVKITGLVDKANIKITDIEGNLVHEVISEGGSIEWDTTAFGKYKVASGVYMILISSEDGLETKTKKVMIIR